MPCKIIYTPSNLCSSKKYCFLHFWLVFFIAKMKTWHEYLIRVYLCFCAILLNTITSFDLWGNCNSLTRCIGSHSTLLIKNMSDNNLQWTVLRCIPPNTQFHALLDIKCIWYEVIMNTMHIFKIGWNRKFHAWLVFAN